jgi:hypothetical protein
MCCVDRHSVKKRNLNVARIRKKAAAYETTTTEPVAMSGFDQAQNQAATMQQNYGKALQTHPPPQEGAINNQTKGLWVNKTS